MVEHDVCQEQVVLGILEELLLLKTQEEQLDQRRSLRRLRFCFNWLGVASEASNSSSFPEISSSGDIAGTIGGETEEKVIMS